MKIEELKVIIRAEIADIKKKTQEVTDSLKDMKEQVEKTTQSTKDLDRAHKEAERATKSHNKVVKQLGQELSRTLKQFDRQKEAISRCKLVAEKSGAAYDKLKNKFDAQQASITDQNVKVAQLERTYQKLAKAMNQHGSYDEMQATEGNLTKQMSDLIQQKRALEESAKYMQQSGSKTTLTSEGVMNKDKLAAAMKRNSLATEELKEKLYNVREAIEQVQNAGMKKLDDSNLGRLGREADKAKQKLRDLENALRDTEKQMSFAGQKSADASGKLEEMKGAAEDTGEKIGKLRKELRGFSGASGALRGMKDRFKGIGDLAKKSAIGMRSARREAGALTKGMRLLGDAFKFTAVYMAASTVIRGAGEGFKNLSQYSQRTNRDLSQLMSALTQLKNSFAAAFAPVLSVVGPILSKLISWITTATNALAHFFAALTGQSKVVVAKKVNQDFAGSLEDAGNAADDANEKAKAYQKTLMGFDQINKLDAPTNSSSGGSGGTGGDLSPGDMFETVEIDSKWANWADRMKEAWANADFTEIGEILGDKLNKALEGIKWDKIKETSRKIAKSIATFLNGFIAETDWKLVGGTIAEGINTAIEFAYTFVTTFDWKKFGDAIGNTITGFFERIDMTKAGKTLSEGIKGLLDTAIQAVKKTDWGKVGEKIADLICNIDWIGVGKRIIKLLGEAIVGACHLLTSFIDRVGAYLTEYIASGNFWKDIFGLVKLSFKITMKIIGSAWELLNSLLDNGAKITVKLVESGVAWLIALISGKDYKTVKKEIELAFKLPESKVVDFVKQVFKFLMLPGPAKLQVLIDLAIQGFNSLSEWLFGRGKKEGRETVGIDRKKNWRTSMSEWVGNKMDLFMGRKKNWKTSMASWVGDKVTLLFGRKKGWKGSLLDWVMNGAKSLALKFGLPKIKVNWGTKTVLGFKISYPNGFSTYAKGGFPEEGPFMMNRGEIAGKFSNGKSVVANNQQITDGIANAVYRAFTAANHSGVSENTFMSGINQLISAVRQIDLSLTDEDVARSATRGQAQLDRRYNPSTA